MKSSLWPVLNANCDCDCEDWDTVRLVSCSVHRLHLPATRIPARPIQATKIIRLSVRMLERRQPEIAATATKLAVHAPCFDRALRGIEMLSIPDTAANV